MGAVRSRRQVSSDWWLPDPFNAFMNMVFPADGAVSPRRRSPGQAIELSCGRTWT